MKRISRFVLFILLIIPACAVPHTGKQVDEGQEQSHRSGTATNQVDGHMATTTPAQPTTDGSIFLPEGASCSFVVQGDEIEGWTWLRDADYQGFGEWRCRGLPAGESLPVTLLALVTDRANGGQGFSSAIKVKYTNPTSGESQAVQIFLQNPLSSEVNESSQGMGYQTTGYLVVPAKFIGADGALSLRVERFSPQIYHVGVNAHSLRIVHPQHAAEFKANGSLVGGWQWLRDADFMDEGAWTFRGLAPQAEDSVLVLDILVTQAANGGSGYSMPVIVTLTNPASGEQATYEHVRAQNLAFEQNPANSTGSGYQAYGSLLMGDRYISPDGELLVHIRRPKGTEYHLAVNENTAGVVQFGVSTTGTTGSELIEATPSVPEDKAACEALSGRWGQIGLAPKEACNLPTTDGGKACRDWGDCESACIADLSTEQLELVRSGERIEATGACAYWHIVVGCQPFVEDGIVHIICID
jgi:hypothetical protein